jgi:hypothetical protein
LIAARRIGQLRLPEKIHLSNASQHDLSALRELTPRLPPDCGLFADKAYCDTETDNFFKEQGSFLVAAYKRRRN